MRGPDIQQDTLFSTVSPEARVPKDHPLRLVHTMVDAALKEMDQDFNALYAASGRDSIPPEKLLRAQLLMALYTIRSERQLMEQIDYNLLFRWFVGFSMDDAVWDHSTFNKNRDTHESKTDKARPTPAASQKLHAQNPAISAPESQNRPAERPSGPRSAWGLGRGSTEQSP